MGKKDMWFQHLFSCKVPLNCEGAAGNRRAALPADGEDADLPEAAARDHGACVPCTSPCAISDAPGPIDFIFSVRSLAIAAAGTVQ